MWIILFIIMFLGSTILLLLYLNRKSKIAKRFWLTIGDQDPDLSRLDSVLGFILTIPLIIWLLFVVVAVLVVVGLPLDSVEGFLIAVITMIVFVVPISMNSAAILAWFEKYEVGHEKRVAGASDKILMALEYEMQGRFDKDAMAKEAAENSGQYLDQQNEIEKAFRDTESPIYDEGGCATLSRFAARHLKSMKGIRENKPERIAKLLCAYHRYEWDVLHLVRDQLRRPAVSEKDEVKTSLPYVHELMAEYDFTTTGGIADLVTLQSRIIETGDEQIAHVDSLPLSEEEKRRLVTMVRSKVEYELKVVERKAGIE